MSTPSRATLWIDPEPRSGAANMAWDRTLLDLAEIEERFVVRLYRWHPHCLSFGRNEPAARRYDRKQVEAMGLDAVRRPTGGRAVWHARELTYAIAAPAAVLGGLREAYAAIHAVLAQAVARLGGTASLASAPVRHAPVDAGACFASPAGGEVMVGGRKVVGSAQVRQGRALLQHGSMLLRDDQSLVAALTLGKPPADGSAPLSTLLGRDVGFTEASEAVAAAAAAAWPLAWERTDAAMPLVSEHMAPLADRLGRYEREFRDPQLTWSR